MALVRRRARELVRRVISEGTGVGEGVCEGEKKSI